MAIVKEHISVACKDINSEENLAVEHLALEGFNILPAILERLHLPLAQFEVPYRSSLFSHLIFGNLSRPHDFITLLLYAMSNEKY